MKTAFNQTSISNKKPSYSAGNPFARALAETEQRAGDNNHAAPDQKNQSTDLFNRQIQTERLQQLAKERMRRQLHDRINPVNAKDVFSAREQQVKKEIDQLRYELKLLVKEVAKFHKDIEITLMTPVSKPGETGAYYINFFQKLRQFIMLLRQKIKSASTWANQFTAKSKKKKAKRGSAGIIIEGADHEQTKSIFDTMHHERSNAYGG